jgi:hypothetical protein
MKVNIDLNQNYKICTNARNAKRNAKQSNKVS